MTHDLLAARLIDLLQQRGRMKGREIAAELGWHDDSDVRMVVGYIKKHSLALIGSKRNGSDKGYWLAEPEEIIKVCRHIEQTALVQLKNCSLQKRLARELIERRQGQLL